jgi:hypothetical protein
MRKFPLLLVLLLLALLAVAPAAQASLVPAADQAISLVAAAADEEEDEGEDPEEGGGEEAEEDEECEPEEGEPCEEEAEAAPEKQADGCLLKKADAAVTVNPGKRRLRVTVHYRTRMPAAVTVTAKLQGPRGAVHLGTDHARFRRSGVYRDTFGLAEKQMKKALAARQLTVELQVADTPPSCVVHLTAHRGGSRKLSWS